MRCFQRICRIALPLLLGLVVAGCQRVENDTGISQRQQVGLVGGAAGGALVAAATGASAPWTVGGALVGAGLGTGIATLGNHGQADAPPSGESFNEFLANPPGVERSWRNPANDDHGTVTVGAETRKAKGGRHALQAVERKNVVDRERLAGGGCHRLPTTWWLVADPDIEPQRPA